MTRKPLLKCVFFFVTIFLVAGCLSDEKVVTNTDQGKPLRLITVLSANTLDPHLVDNSFILNSGTVETLVGLDAKTGKLIPWLADGWSSEDGQNWVFMLHKGVKLHNGKDLTPEMVKASLERSIKVNPAIKESLKIETIEVVGDTLKIKTLMPYPALPSELVHYNSVIIDVTVPDNQIPIGTGAFKFENFDLINDTVVVKFDDYWNGTAKLNKVVIRTNLDASSRFLALQTSDVDIVYRLSVEALALLKDKHNIIVEKMPSTRVHNLLYNYAGKNKNLWNNEEFRKGIDALVDRQGIVDDVMNKYAVVANNPFSGTYPFSPENKEHLYGQNKALMHFQAAGLLVKDGKVFNPNGSKIKLLLITNLAHSELPEIAKTVKKSAEQVGIEIEIQLVENIRSFLQKNDWDFATYSTLTITRGDGAHFLNASFMDNGIDNYGKIADKEIIDLINLLNKTLDQSERYAITQQIGTLIEDRAHNCYILSPYETVAYQKNVKGWLTTSNELEFQMVTKDLFVE